MPVAVFSHLEALRRTALRVICRRALRGHRVVAAPVARVTALTVVAVTLTVALAACSNPQSSRDAHAPVDTVTLFPIAAYDQDVDHWLDPSEPGYDRPFLSPADQQAHFNALYARYFGTGVDAPSPWNSTFVTNRVYRQHGADIAALQRRRIERYDNAGIVGKEGSGSKAIGYGENFRPHTKAWIDAIARNMDVGQFEQVSAYAPEHRAIAIANLPVRELPTLDPSFYDHHLAGEGYPFDNLQISALRPGTPLYVLGSSLDGGWQYVQTPDVQGWVRSDGVAMANDAFVDAWRAAARRSLGAVTVASAPVRDSRGAFRFDAPAGTLLPLVVTRAARQEVAASAASADTAETAAQITPPLRTLLVPARDVDGQAVIRTAQLDDTQIAPTPLAATPRHLAMLMKTLIGRPYGWGNSGFYNDCSSELQSIFAVFGVWLPRHSSTQMDAGQMTDLSASTPAERLDYLAQHGVPMRTLIYIGGHVMLYIGNTTRDGIAVPVVYQDIWGLRPADNSRRSVIGGSVILPLYEHIADDPALQSLAATRIFQVSILGAPIGAVTKPADDEDDPAG